MSLRALTAAGSYAPTATNAAGAVISTQALTVAAATPAAGGALPRTGFDPTGLLVGGGLLLLAGAGALLVVRRPCRAPSPASTRARLIQAHPNDGPGFRRTGAGALAFSRPLCALILAAGVLVLSGCASTPGIARPAPTSSVSRSDPAAYAAQILQGTNEVRRAHGLPALTSSKCAQDAALRRAATLVGGAELTHAPLAGVIARCVPATTAAENLSRAAASPAAVIDAWMKSPGHRSNLLDPALTQIGVGCVLDGEAMLCSQVFLDP